eukprot:2443584-Rhodomonas_salina.1
MFICESITRNGCTPAPALPASLSLLPLLSLSIARCLCVSVCVSVCLCLRLSPLSLCSCLSEGGRQGTGGEGAGAGAGEGRAGTVFGVGVLGYAIRAQRHPRAPVQPCRTPHLLHSPPLHTAAAAHAGYGDKDVGGWHSGGKGLFWI